LSGRCGALRHGFGVAREPAGRRRHPDRRLAGAPGRTRRLGHRPADTLYLQITGSLPRETLDLSTGRSTERAFGDASLTVTAQRQP